MKPARTMQAEDTSEAPAIDWSKAKRVIRPGKKRMTLRAARGVAGKTQAQVAAELGTDQAEVSRLERRSDALVSTLRKYARAVGVELDLVLVYPNGQRVVVADPEE